LKEGVIHMLSTKSDSLTNSLIDLNLSRNEALLYIYLSQNEKRSALEISRDMKISRTKAYRILEALVKKGFVEEIIDYPGRRFKAKSYDVIEKLIREESERVQKLQASLPSLLNQLESLQLQSRSNSKITYHKGIDGLKQITWNSIKADKELRIFEVDQDMSKFTGTSFAERVREEFSMKGTMTKQLTNSPSIEGFTDNEEYVNRCMQVKYIDPKRLSLDFELLIYNEVVALYSTAEEEPFGIEIYNKDLARMQKQIFDFIWDGSVKMIVGERGEARI
jgi:sugar-specific transcriptional regulator TrmB